MGQLKMPIEQLKQLDERFLRKESPNGIFLVIDYVLHVDGVNNQRLNAHSISIVLQN